MHVQARRAGRRAVLAAACALPLAAIGRGRALAADFALKLGNNLPPTHPLNVRQTEAAARVKAASGGRVEINIFPNNQLGSDTEMLSQIRSGALEMCTMSGPILATLVPAASISGIGFAFHDYDTVWRAVDGKLGAYIRGEIDRRGLHAFDRMFDNGFRQITSSTREIRTPDDLHGFKIRVPVSPLWTSLFKALGASPTSINFSEVYSALQTKIVEGQENPLALIEIARLYEVQKSCSLTDHMWDGFWMLCNGRVWRSLPPDLQAIVAHELDRAAVEERADLATLNTTVQAKLKGQGLAFVEPDKAAFRDALKKAGFYQDWKKRYGDAAWATLEAAAGSLA